MTVSSAKTTLGELRVFIANLVVCPFFQNWLAAIFDEQLGFMILAALSSKKTLHRSKGDNANNICMEVIYKQWCKLKYTAGRYKSNIITLTSAASVKRIVTRLCNYLSITENLWVTAVAENEGHEGVKEALHIARMGFL